MEKVQKKRWKKYLLYVLGVFVLIAAIGSCNSDGNTGELQAQVTELQKENKELNTQLEELKKQNETLETEAEESKEQIAQLESDKENENADYDTLKAENEALQSQIVGLEAQIQELQVQEEQKVTENTSNDEVVAPQSDSFESAQEPESYTVYITKTGSKYHRDGCRYLRQSQIAIEKDKAVSQGYSPCSVCNP